MSEQIRQDDVVQVVKGGEWGVMGIVMSIIGKELLLWGRNPGYLGSENYKLQVRADHVMRIGRGRVRPLRPGESRKPVPTQTQAPKEEEPKQQLAPMPVKQEPTPEPVKRGPGRPRKNPLPEPQQPTETQASPPPIVRDEETQAAALAFGLDIDSESIIPKPKPQEEINPELLKTVQVRRPSAYEVHRPTQNPKV